MTTATFERVTSETRVLVELDLAGQGRSQVNTGIGFLDHLLTAFARHARLDLVVRCDGDLVVDDHHTVEDVALGIGSALDRALGERKGMYRFGHAIVPLDEALSRVAIDLSGRPFADVNLGLRRESIGSLATENITHFLRSFASAGRMALHVDVLKGENDHHRAESAFKATALALRQALASTGFDDVPSTKGVL
jgi:imidazoleglycerol-phosphate dehydratase